jgi:hypothetical protein
VASLADWLNKSVDAVRSAVSRITPGDGGAGPSSAPHHPDGGAPPPPATGGAWEHRGHPGFGGWVWTGDGPPTSGPPVGIDSPAQGPMYQPPDVQDAPPPYHPPEPPPDYRPHGHPGLGGVFDFPKPAPAPPVAPEDHHGGGDSGGGDPGDGFGSGADPLDGVDIDATVQHTIDTVLAGNPSPPIDEGHHFGGGGDTGDLTDDAFGVGSGMPDIDAIVTAATDAAGGTDSAPSSMPPDAPVHPPAEEPPTYVPDGPDTGDDFSPPMAPPPRPVDDGDGLGDMC